jgi:hypothetical protein
MAPLSRSLSDFQPLLSEQWPVESAVRERLVVQKDDSRVYLYEDKAFKNSITQDGFCSRALKGFFDDADDANFFLLEYSDLEFAKKVLLAIADDEQIVIDNDFGTVMRGNEFIQKLKDESDWDWRRPRR